RLIARFGAERLFAASVTVAALRWLAISLVASRAALLMLAPLHGVSFACAYAAAVTIMRARAPAEAPTPAQGLLSSALGAGSGLGMLCAGALLDRFGGRVLFSLAAAVAASAATFAWLYSQAARAERPAARAAA